MGKSRYSKTKAAGLLCGMSRYKQKFEMKQTGGLVAAENRQMRRAKEKK